MPLPRSRPLAHARRNCPYVCPNRRSKTIIEVNEGPRLSPPIARADGSPDRAGVEAQEGRSAALVTSRCSAWATAAGAPRTAGTAGTTGAAPLARIQSRAGAAGAAAAAATGAGATGATATGAATAATRARATRATASGTARARTTSCKSHERLTNHGQRQYDSYCPFG